MRRLYTDTTRSGFSDLISPGALHHGQILRRQMANELPKNIWCPNVYQRVNCLRIICQFLWVCEHTCN